MQTSKADIDETITRKEEELTGLKRAMQRIQTLQVELMVLKRARAIMGLNGNGKHVLAESPSLFQPIATKNDSIPMLVVSALREAERPLTASEIFTSLTAKGHEVKQQSMIGAIYRCVKNRQHFVITTPGTFGLMEWKKDPNRKPL